MKGLGAPLAILAVLGLGYLYLTGQLPGFGAGTNAVPVEGVQNQAKSFIGTPLFYHIAAAGVLAGVAIWVWGKIGPVGRGVALVIAAIAGTIWLTH